MNNLKKTTRLLLLMAFYVFCVSGQGQEEPPSPPRNPTPFPSDLFLRLGDTLGDGFDDAGQKLSASIFESLTDRELFETTLLGDLKAGLEVQRKVFDNQDIIDSFTVIDIMRAPLYFPVPILNQEIGALNVGHGAFGINLGLTFGANAYSIRQISPSDWRSLIDPNPKEINRHLKRLQREASALSEDISDSFSGNFSGNLSGNLSDERQVPQLAHTENQEDDEDGLSRFIFWRSQNPRNRARYHKLWRILTHPLSLPLTAKLMDKYPIGDVASYGLEGAIQLGISAGWSDFEVFGQALSKTRAGLGLTTYLRGDFRLSLWKENKNFVQVKLSRQRSRGATVDVGNLSWDQELFEGFIVLDKKYFNITEEFMPFSFAVNRNWARQFDIGYRYDMRVPAARKAYNLAVLGRLKQSALLAQKESSGVTKSFSRTSQSRSRSQAHKIKLSFFFEKANSNKRSQTWATISMDDVEHKLYTASNLTLRAYDTLWGHSELKRHHFLTTFNERRYRRNPKEGIGLRIEGRLEDSHTSAKELYNYLKELEVAIAKPGLFPRPPKYFPQMTCREQERHLERVSDKQCQQETASQNKKLARYGKTSFFYQVDLNLDHLKNIQKASKRQFWQAMEIAFGMKEGKWSKPWKRTLSLAINSYATVLNVPLALFDINLKPGGRLIVAWRFYRSWKKLKDLKDPQELVKAFAKVYRTMHYSPELVMATRLLAGTEKAKYFFTAKADLVFGQRSEGGSTLSSIFPIGDEAHRRIEFDRNGPRMTSDREAQITNMRYDKIDETTAQVSFNLKKTPNYLYFRVDQSPQWGRHKNLTRLIIKNNGEFKGGLNVLTITSTPTSGYLEKLRRAFFNGKFTNFLMAYSIEKERFGPVSSVRFRLRDYRDIDIDF